MALTKIVGTKCNVSIEVAAWDGVVAEVDLSCVCMFSREMAGKPPQGGLAHVDMALGGRLLELRRDGYFQASSGESLLIGPPASTIAASSLLIIGLGDPSHWSAQAMTGALRGAAGTAVALQVGTVAFAPSMLDSGLLPAQTENAAAYMVRGLVAALNVNTRLHELGLAPEPALKRWIFDVGESHFEQAAEQFHAELQRH